MSYFILQYICKQLELKKLNQTSQLLSKFNAENIIILIDSVTSDVEFEELYNISFEHIPFKTYKKIRVVPINEIKEYTIYINYVLNIVELNINFSD
jgi:Ni,Fe-hydrogenase maturation factor